MTTSSRQSVYPAEIDSGGARLRGELTIPPNPAGVVVIPHQGSCMRLCPGSRSVANRLQSRGVASLVVDLLTIDEEILTPLPKDDLELPAERIQAVLDWLAHDPVVGRLPLGLYAYGKGNCGAACLMAAAERPGAISAIAMRCARPDRAGRALGQPMPPTLLIVGGDDVMIQRQNRDAFRRLRTDQKHLELVDGASGGFAEPGKFDEATCLVVDWFAGYLAPVPKNGPCVR